MDKHQQPERRPAVVTGASSGIGAATAVALAAIGHPGALGAHRTEKCEDVARGIREAGGEAAAFTFEPRRSLPISPV
jgi:NADP-dependent 3-hydroxy acid dehydrogenase YdfG